MTPQGIAKYRENTNKPQHQGITARRFCAGCKKHRSIAQFFDKKRQPVHEKCELCRIKGK